VKRLLQVRVPYLGLDRAALPETAGEARRRITAFASAHGADRRLQADIAHAVTEAVTNVIVHAYPPGRVGSLSIAADIEEDGLEIVVTDDGEGFRPGTSPGLGAGLSIIAETTNDFAIRERQPRGIELWMRFDLR
jgi:serine/threonine-protein kinase RsbW/stage II sporulation protein AB (anti-sigma F factor)